MFTKFLIHLQQQYAGFLALFIVLGGTSYAVATGSIDSREIKDNTVSSRDIRNNQVSSSDVKNRSLLRQDFKQGQLPAPQGIPGPQGPKGSPGATNVTVRHSATRTIAATASCLPGERAVGGGGTPEDIGGLYASFPVVTNGTPTGWTAHLGENSHITAHVVCAAP